MKRNLNHLAFITILIIVLVSCVNNKKITSTSGGSEMLYASQWDLTELNGSSSNLGNAYLLFYPGQVARVSGNAGCNKLNGTFDLMGEKTIKFSPILTTKMACKNGVDESSFLAALQKADNWGINKNQLFLYSGKALLAKLNAVVAERSKLSGTWELNYISGSRIAFEGLYPDKKPQIQFKLDVNEVGGNTGCNGFSSKISIDGNKINIQEPFSKTMMFCEGGGETSFLNMIKKVNKFAVTNGNTLNFMIDDVAVMRFTKITTGKG